MRYMMTAMLAVSMLSACGVEEFATSEQEIGGGPRGQFCWVSPDRAVCSTPTCRDPDCTAPRYMCCDYGEIGQPLGCYYAVDVGACSI